MNNFPFLLVVVYLITIQIFRAYHNLFRPEFIDGPVIVIK